MNKRFLFLSVVVLVILGVAINQVFAATYSKANQETQVTLERQEIHQDDVQTELCILLPSLAPWEPFATLTVDGKAIYNSEVALINAKDPGVMESQKRCFLFTFPVSTSDVVSSSVILKLEKLSIEIQGGLLSNAGADAAKARLRNDYPQLDFKVIIEKGKGGGGAYIQLLSKPDNLSDKQAIQLIQQASMDVVPGNWQTNIILK